MLRIDLETFSPIDIKHGVYKYSQGAEILICAYQYDNEPIEAIDVYNDGLPTHLVNDILNPKVQKSAFNAQFERIMLSKHLNKYIHPRGWLCTKVAAAQSGVIGDLNVVSQVLGVAHKNPEGKRLINYFSKPCKPTKVNGGRTRNLPHHAPNDWQAFIQYCKDDVAAEAGIRWEYFDAEDYWLDQIINDTGIQLDIPFIQNCIKAFEAFQEDTMSKLRQLTGLDNPNSGQQFGAWMEKTLGHKPESLDKAHMKAYLERWPQCEELILKSQLSATSVRKFKRMLECEVNGRIFGTMRHYGAGTGRTAGALIQPQNLPRDEIDDELHENISAWDAKTDLAEYKSLKEGFKPSDLKAVIRPCLIGKLKILDFSAIEARVLAILAGAKDRIEVFKTHGMIYEYSAANMFGVDIKTIRKGEENYHLRAKGKVAELALGYQGSVGAMAQMGFDGTEEEALALVRAWRKANPMICNLWYRVQDKVKDVIHGVRSHKNFEYKNGNLYITLLSGRKLVYRNAGIDDECNIYYYRVVNRKWTKVFTYGGKLVENIVQAVSRDLLFNALHNVHNAGYKIVLHVHDEIVCDGTHGTLEEMEKLMCKMPPWAKDWPIRANGDESNFYLK